MKTQKQPIRNRVLALFSGVVLVLGIVTMSGCFLWFGPVDPFLWRVTVTPAGATPFQDVTVTVNVLRADVRVHYTVSGNDGYYDEGALTTNEAGEISFMIPKPLLSGQNIPGDLPNPLIETVNVWVPAWGPNAVKVLTHTYTLPGTQ